MIPGISFKKAWTKISQSNATFIPWQGASLSSKGRAREGSLNNKYETKYKIVKKMDQSSVVTVRANHLIMGNDRLKFS